MPEGDVETTTGHCVYCKKDTTWTVTTLPDDWLRFECSRCKKISRDVLLADTG